MTRINENYKKLQAGYLFPEIARRVGEFSAANPDANIIRLGIGDITLPLAPAVVEALRAAADEMGREAGVHGYGPESGYDFLIEAICQNDYHERGVEVSADEVFVSDGSKQDSGNIQEIFGADCKVAVTDPSYPVYVDTNVMAGRTGAANPDGTHEGILYLPATEANDFAPEPPTEPVDFVYLCSPNNPTGSVAPRANLTAWVAWAHEHDAILIFDAAYDAFIQDDELPHSIYEIDGARECAIEMRSYSKRAGFTGVRCAYTVVPRQLEGTTSAGDRVGFADLWSRRQATKFNSVPYLVQRAAAAVYSPEGRKQTGEQVAHYMRNAALLREGLQAAGFAVFGGEHAPYVWMKTPGGLSSWDCFGELLTKAHVVGTPGSGFGASGEGYIRISAFNSRENVEEAVARIGRVFSGRTSQHSAVCREWTGRRNQMSKQDDETPPVDSKIAKRLFEMRTVLIHGEVTSRMARDVTAQLLALSSESNDDITIYVHSEGGHVESGDSIHDMISFVKPRIKMVGTGWVASAGVHIYLAVPKKDRYSLPNTRFLIHQPMGGAGGAASDIQIEAEEILKARDRLNQLIAEKTGQPIEQVSRDTDRNHWMSPEEARDYGIVGKIITSAREL